MEKIRQYGEKNEKWILQKNLEPKVTFLVYFPITREFRNEKKIVCTTVPSVCSQIRFGYFNLSDNLLFTLMHFLVTSHGELQNVA